MQVFCLNKDVLVKRRLDDLAPITAAILVFLVINWAGVFILAENTAQKEIERSYTSSQQYSLQSAEQVARTIDQIQSLIDLSAYQISRYGAAVALKNLANAGAFATKPFVQVAFVDTDGFIVATDAGLDLLRTDLRDREHIRVHLEGKIEGLYIGAPVLGRVSGKWSIQFTRRVHDRGGQFIGIIVASVDPFYFQRFWTNILGENRIISLMKMDGTTLTRSFALDWILESQIRRPDIIEAIGEKETGRLVADSTDGVERFNFFARVPGYPLYIITGEVASQVTASYRTTQKWYYLVGGAVTFIFLVLGLWLVAVAGRLRREKLLAKQAEEAKSAFLAIMSHELRTPLNALTGFVGLMSKTKLDDEQLIYIRTMQHAAQALRNIISDVLDFSKLESGALLIENTPFNIHECFSELDKVTRLLVGDKPVVVQTARSSDVPEWGVADGSRFYQALLNLCGNAAKFTQAGQILISVRIDKRQGRDHLVVDVSDTGPGIDKEVISKLFTPFEQGEAVGKIRAAGTGLGLSISKMLLKLMGGTISVKSTPGLGSTFTLDLPFERYEGRLDHKEAPSYHKLNRSLRALVADDSRSSRMLLRIILEQKGHRVVEAEDGVQALELISKQDFDVVFLDIQMPRLSGFAVARNVTEMARVRPVPMIVGLSAMALQEDIEAAREAGISTYITKPILEDQLDNVLRLADQRMLSGA